MDTHVRDNLRFLGGLGSGIGTSLPGAPADQEPFILVDSLTTPTYLWHLRYFNSLASSKWVCTGGMPATSVTTPGVSTSSSSYNAAWAQTLVLPMSGIYAVTLQGKTTTTGNWISWISISYDVGATAANDDWSTTVICPWNTVVESGSATNTYWHTVSGSNTLTVKVRSQDAGNTATVNNCRIQAIPVRLG